jgi:hypothetical protein
MHALEWRAARRERKRYIDAFTQANIPIELPVLDMLRDYLRTRIQTERLERTLLEHIPNDASLPLPTITPADLDLLQKQQDKLRKLRLELTNLLPKPAPAPMTKWMKKALEAEKQRQQQAAAKPAHPAPQAPVPQPQVTQVPQVPLQVFNDPIPDYDNDPLEEFYHPTKPTTGPREHPADKLEREWKEKGVIRFATPNEIAEMEKAQEDSERQAAEWERKRLSVSGVATALPDHAAPDLTCCGGVSAPATSRAIEAPRSCGVPTDRSPLPSNATPDPIHDSMLHAQQRSSAALPDTTTQITSPASPIRPISPIPETATETPTKRNRNPYNIPPFQFLCDRPKPGGCTVIYTTPPDRPPKPRKSYFTNDAPYP